MFNLANNLTLIRILTIPVFVLLLYFPARITCLLAAVIFVAATVTDFFDGLLARRYNMESNMGKLLDPLADKLLVVAALIMLTSLQWLAAWIVILIISRELMVTGVRSMAAERGMVISADIFGKFKTVLQDVAIVPLVLHYSWLGFDPRPWGEGLMLAALIVTLLSGGNYVWKFARSLGQEEETSANH
ncbi:MAG: CDP-diacylglycerol--glycerol-3-phosphate 3-phosphatidyltransferase [Desulfohalobiaceae bacterium]|nr:CDP-diacylglycerol--glycerol-3-phosphate 3-phosphatidyltransferase [Desulfohalobiaceae bacterium]MCF8086057.1 CDP-diacylglycerol--glycerol-3-phosphate 3-phosphatidyltransferase [Desulfohalobiaceae bacterium]